METAGEIKHQYPGSHIASNPQLRFMLLTLHAAYAGKAITLVHSRDRLLQNCPVSASASALQILKKVFPLHQCHSVFIQ